MLKNYRWLILTSIVFAADQLTKGLAVQHLMLYEPVPMVPYVNLTLMHNTGAAFSLLNQAGGWQRWLLAGIALLASAVMLRWLYKLPVQRFWAAAGLSLVLGGALANLWDRVSLSYVIDFLDIYIGQWHWPAFNLADSAIVVGVILLIIDSCYKSQQEENK